MARGCGVERVVGDARLPGRLGIPGAVDQAVRLALEEPRLRLRRPPEWDLVQLPRAPEIISALAQESREPHPRGAVIRGAPEQVPERSLRVVRPALPDPGVDRLDVQRRPVGPEPPGVQGSKPGDKGPGPEETMEDKGQTTKGKGQ